MTSNVSVICLLWECTTTLWLISGVTTGVVYKLSVRLYMYKDKNAKLDSQKKTPNFLINVCMAYHTLCYQQAVFQFLVPHHSWSYEVSQHTDVCMCVFVYLPIYPSTYLSVFSTDTTISVILSFSCLLFLRI